MVNFTGAFQNKDLLITFVLQFFYTANSLESNKITAKKSDIKIPRNHLLFVSP